MERLTIESDGYFAVRGKNCYEDQNEDYCGPAIDRLAAYEDTGLTPKDVVDLMSNHGMALGELADPAEVVADYLLDNGVTIQRWIPVTERLPDHNKSVIVYCENLTIQGGHTVHIGSCDKMSGTAFWFLRTQPGVSSFPNHEWRVTHWMPLPQFPEKEGS